MRTGADGQTVAERKQGRQPSRWGIWLGIADNSFTRQKTVKFGDASAVNSGRLWSVLTLILLILAWWLATIGGIIDPLFWPPLEGSLYPWDNPDRARPGVVDRFVSLFVDGYRNISLWEHVGTSVKRVLLGVIIGAIVGIPLGFAMGLNSVARGLLRSHRRVHPPDPAAGAHPAGDPVAGDRRGRQDLPALPGRTLHHADRGPGRRELGADLQGFTRPTRWAPRSFRCCATSSCRTPLPEIFTGLRTSMGVCWGTLVAAELVAADQGVGSMMMIAKNFLQTDVVVIGIIIIGAIGFAIEMFMRLPRIVVDPLEGEGLTPRPPPGSGSVARRQGIATVQH